MCIGCVFATENGIYLLQLRVHGPRGLFAVVMCAAAAAAVRGGEQLQPDAAMDARL